MFNNNNDEAKCINMDKFEEIEKNYQNNPSNETTNKIIIQIIIIQMKTIL